MGGAAAGLLAQWGLIRVFRMKPNDLLLWGAGLACLGNVATVFAPSYGAAVTAYALTSIGYGFARPGFSAGASLGVSAKEQGNVAGAITAVNGSCVIITPILGVWLYDHLHFAPFALNALVLLAMAVFALSNRRLREAGEMQDEAEELEETQIRDGAAALAQVGMGETPAMHETALERSGPVNQLRRRLRALRLLEERRRRARLRSGADQLGPE